MPDLRPASTTGICFLFSGCALIGLCSIDHRFQQYYAKNKSQVAIGFVLALMCRDLAYFLGNPYMGSQVRECPVSRPRPF